MVQMQRLTIQPSQIVGEQLTLTPAQHHYLCHVLRLQTGDRFIALDGQGNTWLTELNAQPLTAQLLQAIAAKTEISALTITLLMALPKTGMDDIIRQTTELGVTQIVPILSDRTLLKPSEQKRERWQRIAQEAAEQSERQIVPAILSPQSFTVALQTWNTQNSIGYLCEPRGNHPHLFTCLQAVNLIPLQLQPPMEQPVTERQIEQQIIEQQICVAIGSEGGWTDREIEQAIAVGYQPVSLGCRILRAVTAPVVALSLIAARFEASL